MCWRAIVGIQGTTFGRTAEVAGIMNEAVLYPTYAQPENDARAAQVLTEAFPGREIIGVDCRALIKQHGSLHCVTMQYPESVKNQIAQ